MNSSLSHFSDEPVQCTCSLKILVVNQFCELVHLVILLVNQFNSNNSLGHFLMNQFIAPVHLKFCWWTSSVIFIEPVQCTSSLGHFASKPVPPCILLASSCSSFCLLCARCTPSGCGLRWYAPIWSSPYGPKVCCDRSRPPDLFFVSCDQPKTDFRLVATFWDHGRDEPF